MFDLGLESDYRTFPAALEIEGRPYFLVRDEGGYRLLSSVCPHQGGTVEATATAFECPQHGWRFDLQSGRCLTGPSAQLASLAVVVDAGRLFAAVEAPEPWLGADERVLPAFPDDLRIRLVGHASLEIRHAGFTLLTDPWLTGPAFLGAWVTYPDAGIDPATIQPDALWISHGHSDHFHKPTLAAFRRDTPVYVPDFPNGRLVRELGDMGFTRVHAMQFGEPYDVGPGFRITCYEPPGLWNDAIVLMEVGGVRILNINDAGVNHRIAALVAPVDVISAAFSPASSYPFAWEHLTPEAKATIIERARVGNLRLLHQAAKRYQPKYLIPFASHFALWHPSHREYMSQIRRNTIDDVVRAFERSPVQVIDILPGGWWEPASGAIDRGPDRTDLYDPERIRRWLDDKFDQKVFERHHPPMGELGRDEVAAYFLRLNDVPDIAFCEDVTVSVEGTQAGRAPLQLSFEIIDGRLSLLSDPPGEPNLVMRVPLNILRHIIKTDASWDEAHVGFWCRFTRAPDVFAAGFWRLLQSPYFLRSGFSAPVPAAPTIAVDASVAELIERFGARAERLLGRYGLHCAGCPHAPAESVRLAAHRHGVGPASTERLIRELNVVLQGESELATTHE